MDNYPAASAKPALATPLLKLTCSSTTESHTNSQFMESGIRPNSALVSFYPTREPGTWCLISGRPRKSSREALREIFGYSECCGEFYTCQSRRASKHKRCKTFVTCRRPVENFQPPGTPLPLLGCSQTLTLSACVFGHGQVESHLAFMCNLGWVYT